MPSPTQINPDSPAAKGYETPSFDALRPRYKLFVLHYYKNHDETQAAIAAGYSVKTAEIFGFEIGRLPEVVKSLEEISARRMNASEFSRASVIDRLKVEASVTFADLAEEVYFEIADKKGKKWKPKALKDIEVQFRGCTGLVTVSREGNAQFNHTAQLKARELLAKYMKWDREGAESAPPIHFDFSGLKG